MALTTGEQILTGTDIETHTLDDPIGQHTLTVMNLAGTARIHYTKDGSTPVVGAAGTYVVPPGCASSTKTDPSARQITVKVLGDGNEYAVEVDAP